MADDLLPDSRPWALFEAKGWTDGSFDSKDVSDGSKSLRSRVVPARSTAKPRKERKFTTKELKDFVRPYAMDAISVYNERAGTKYKLVEPGNVTNLLLPGRFLHHIDFTAKKTDVTEAPVEMFFAELITLNKVRSVECCKCMGPKESISGDKNNGCCHCMSYNVQHPRDGGFRAGRYGLFTDEGYFSDE